MTEEFVLAEYPKALARLEEQFKHCHGEAIHLRQVTSSKGIPGPTVTTRVEFAFSGPNGFIRRIIEQPKPVPEAPKPNPTPGASPPKSRIEPDYEAVIFFNRTYSCRLNKKTPGADFLIRWLSPDPADAERPIMTSSGHFVGRSFSANQPLISRLFKSEGFRINKITPIEPGNPDRQFRIEFTIPKRDVTKPRGNRLTWGWFQVSPASGWVLREYGLVFTSPDGQKTSEIGQIEYDSGSHGSLKPVSVQYRYYTQEYATNPALTDAGVIARMSDDFRFTRLSFGDLPERDFTLSGFGLPEYGQTVAQAADARRYPWWIPGSAALLAVAALILKRLGSRRPAAPADLRPTT